MRFDMGKSRAPEGDALGDATVFESDGRSDIDVDRELYGLDCDR